MKSFALKSVQPLYKMHYGLRHKWLRENITERVHIGKTSNV